MRITGPSESRTEKYEFRKGEKLHLDTIYDIQALAGGDWWDHIFTTNIDGNEAPSDEVLITRDVTIFIRWKKGDVVL